MPVQDLLDDGLFDQFHKSLVELNMDSSEELQSYINKLQLAVEQGRQKLLQSDGVDGRMEVSVYQISNSFFFAYNTILSQLKKKSYRQIMTKYNDL